ncbi:hypothetical protein [Enterobacter hormaechei]|uniref:hypothetical protein n=1 Tax=Enterobacter hormaechei TaxID=158836 RepID=UPI0024DE6E31|nr:hypothetical protein [Enterobacter hormaechei]MDK2357155.1 hypothetical protein [Enterobacter hormaechei]
MPLLFFFIAIVITALNWEWVNENLVILGTISTTFAFFATAWAAHEARASAKAAFNAVKLTQQTLTEARKADFKQWYNALLEQHKDHHNEAIDRIDNNQALKKDMLSDTLSIAYSYIVRDNIISSYCKLIYSILDYVDCEFYIQSEDKTPQKTYLSRLNSSMRQDLKLIVAIYALKGAEVTPKHGKRMFYLLTKYAFFEEDILFADAMSHKLSPNKYAETLFTDSFGKQLNDSIFDAICLDKPTTKEKIFNSYIPEPGTKQTITYIYANIFQKAFIKRFDHYTSYLDKYLIESATDIDSKLSKIIKEIYSYEGSTVDISGRRIKKSDNLIINNAQDLSRLYQQYAKKTAYYRTKIRLSNVNIHFRNNAYSSVTANNYESSLNNYSYYYRLKRYCEDGSFDNIKKNIIVGADTILTQHRIKMTSFTNYD